MKQELARRMATMKDQVRRRVHPGLTSLVF